MFNTVLLIFLFVVIFILIIKNNALITRWQRQSSLVELMKRLESLQSLTKRPASTETEFTDKLKDILSELSANKFELPDFVDLHLDRFRIAIEAIASANRVKRATPADVLDFGNVYLAQLPHLTHAISIVERELVRYQNLIITKTIGQDRRKNRRVLKWFQRSDFTGLVTCMIVLFSFYAAIEFNSQFAISFGGSALVILGLIYEAQYLPRISSSGELRARTFSSGVPTVSEVNFREFFVTHFGFFQVITGTVLNTTGPYLIDWLEALADLIS